MLEKKIPAYRWRTAASIAAQCSQQLAVMNGAMLAEVRGDETLNERIRRQPGGPDAVDQDSEIQRLLRLPMPRRLVAILDKHFAHDSDELTKTVRRASLLRIQRNPLESIESYLNRFERLWRAVRSDGASLQPQNVTAALYVGANLELPQQLAIRQNFDFANSGEPTAPQQLMALIRRLFLKNPLQLHNQTQPCSQQFAVMNGVLFGRFFADYTFSTRQADVFQIATARKQPRSRTRRNTRNSKRRGRQDDAGEGINSRRTAQITAAELRSTIGTPATRAPPQHSPSEYLPRTDAAPRFGFAAPRFGFAALVAL